MFKWERFTSTSWARETALVMSLATFWRVTHSTFSRYNDQKLIEVEPLYHKMESSETYVIKRKRGSAKHVGTASSLNT